jgi:type I restriction enzyme S subunit
VFDFSKTKFIPADFAAQMRTGVLESRDVLIYKDGGKPGDFRPHVGMYGDGFPFTRMTINEHVYRVRAASPLTEPYLYFWLSTETSTAAMRRLGTGAAIPGLNSTALKSVPVAIPPTNIQQRLFTALEALVGEALAAASEARRLAKARDELLPLLLSGQVRVGDVAA